MNFEPLRALVAQRANTTLPRFIVNHKMDLWAVFVFSLPEEERGHYNCNACRHFVERYGAIVFLDPSGRRSTLWDPEGVPEDFREACTAMHKLLLEAPIISPFVTDKHAWGTPENVSKKGKEWTHFYANIPDQAHDPLRDAGQKMAFYIQEMEVFRNAFSDYSLEVVDEGIRVLESGNFTRSAGPLANLKWYRQGLLGKRNNDLLWLAIVTAPPGFAHIRNNVVATLLDDIKAGASFEAASRRWAEKMDPLHYQRSTKEASEGAVKAAQKLVETLGVERSFARRYALLEDVPASARVFVRSVAEVAPGKLFGQLVPPKPTVPRMELPPITVTWTQLKEKLRDCSTLEVMLPARGSYYGLLTATDPDAPCLLRWDNHVSWYFYHPASSASMWGLTSGWRSVDMVFESPNLWGGQPAENRFVALAFKEAQDTNNSQLGLFPEILKSEYHPIRAVVEANNRTSSPSGRGTASGYALKPGLTETVRVDGVVYKVLGW